MKWTVDRALDDPSVDKTRVSGAGRYSFWLKGISTEISVTLSRNRARGGYDFELSHFIRTPTHSGAYMPSSAWGDDLPNALHIAVTAITEYYAEAVKKGIKPSEEWLIQNTRGS